MTTEPLDLNDADIKQLIVRENDPDKRVFLIVLNSINTSLKGNTALTGKLSEEFSKHVESFEKHVEKEEALLNQGKGMWRIISGILFVTQAITGYGWVRFDEHFSVLDKLLAQGRVEDSVHDTQILAFEKRIADLEKKLSKEH
jgi:hypothetical protein